MSGGRPAPGPAPGGRTRSGPPGPRPGPRARSAAASRPSTRPAAGCRRPARGDAPAPPRRGPPGVQDDQDPPVAFRPPGPDHHVTPAGCRPPVDGADVVADDVLAQGVELRARPAQQRAVLAVELAQLREFLAQVPAAAERRQYPHAPGHVVAALPGGQAQRPERADDNGGGYLVATPVRGERA